MALIGFQWAQADLDRKLDSILAPAIKLETGAHWSQAGFGKIFCAMSNMPSTEALWQQYLNRLVQQFIPTITKQPLGLSVDEHDSAFWVDDYHGIRSELQEAPKFCLCFFSIR